VSELSPAPTQCRQMLAYFSREHLRMQQISCRIKENSAIPQKHCSNKGTRLSRNLENQQRSLQTSSSNKLLSSLGVAKSFQRVGGRYTHSKSERERERERERRTHARARTHTHTHIIYKERLLTKSLCY